MRFLCIAPKSDNWFEAASLDDSEFIQKHIQFAGKFDSRDTANERKTVYGTAAIHLAAMFNSRQALQELYEKEHNLRTKAPIKIQTSMLPNATAFELSAGEDALHISLARANFSFSKQILLFCQQNPQLSVIGNIDDDGHSHLMILAYFPFNQEVKELMNHKMLLSEFSSCVEGRGFLAICCQMGRDEHFEFIVKKAAQSKQILQHLYLELTSVHKQKTIFDFLRVSVNYEKCSTSSDSKQKCVEYVRELLPMALRFLEKDGKTYGMHLSEFFKHCEEKINVESPDVDLNTFGDDFEEKISVEEKLDDDKNEAEQSNCQVDGTIDDIDKEQEEHQSSAPEQE